MSTLMTRWNVGSPMRFWKSTLLLILFGVASFVGVMNGVAKAEGNKPSRAVALFDQALKHVDEGNFQAAVSNFEDAHALEPHYLVLYNLALAYAALGRYWDAVSTLETYLVDGSGKITQQRRRDVESLIQKYRSKFAVLEVSNVPEGAQLKIDDGSPLSGAALAQIVLSPGLHQLLLRAEGYETHRQRINMVPGQVFKLHAELEASKRNALPLVPLVVECFLPDVDVLVDGEPVAKTVGKPEHLNLKVREGVRLVQFSRSGYTSSKASVVVGKGEQKRTLACNLRPVASRSGQRARLRILVSEPNSASTLDGKIYAGEGVVPGRHLVVVRRQGFQEWSQIVTARAGKTQQVGVQLLPTDEFRIAYEKRADRQRNWAYVLGGSGLALGTGALALRLANNARYKNWRSHADMGDLNDEQRVSIKRADAIAGIAAVSGALLLGGGAWLYFSGDDPNRYRGLRYEIGGSGVAVQGTF